MLHSRFSSTSKQESNYKVLDLEADVILDQIWGIVMGEVSMFCIERNRNNCTRRVDSGRL